MTVQGFAFREVMTGVLIPDAETAPHDAHGSEPIQIELDLVVEIDDLKAFVADPLHRGRITGTVRSPQLGGSRQIEHGRLNLFPRPTPAGHSEMRYVVWFRDEGGDPRALIGLKTLRAGQISHIWRHLTAMQSDLLPGHVDALQPMGTERLASGLISIGLRAIPRELASTRGRGRSPAHNAVAVARFAAFFAGSVIAAYRNRPARRTDRRGVAR